MTTPVPKREGHIVYAHRDGETGLQAILQHLPDVALVDIGLPGIDGYEVARQVRSTPACNNTFLIALTGYGQHADVENAFAAGFDTHLVKPIDPDELMVHLQCGLKPPEAKPS